MSDTQNKQEVNFVCTFFSCGDKELKSFRQLPRNKRMIEDRKKCKKINNQ